MLWMTTVLVTAFVLFPDCVEAAAARPRARTEVVGSVTGVPRGLRSALGAESIELATQPRYHLPLCGDWSEFQRLPNANLNGQLDLSPPIVT